MAYIRKQRGKWQVGIRKKGYPNVYKSFIELKDARKFARVYYGAIIAHIINNSNETMV